MPQPLAGRAVVGPRAPAIDGEDVGVLYDEPRDRPWARVTAGRLARDAAGQPGAGDARATAKRT